MVMEKDNLSDKHRLACVYIETTMVESYLQ